MNGDPVIASHVVQCVWPIVDTSYTVRELIGQACADLDTIVERLNALVVGPAVWRVRPAGRVLGWTAYPGYVLIGSVPAQPLAPRRPWAPGRDIDEVKVRRAADGEALVLGRAEKA